MTSIAIIMTGSSVWTMKDGTPHPTGFWAEEFVKPHQTFTAAGFDVTLSTPQGRTPAVDPLSYNLAYNNNDQSVVDSYQEYLGGLRDRLEHRPAELSGGEKRLLAHRHDAGEFILPPPAVVP